MTMPRDGTKNLIPTNRLSKEEVKKIAHNGGVISGAVRRKKRDIKAFLDILLEKELKTKDGKLMQGSERIATALFTKAANGDLKAIQQVLDLKYGKEQKIDMTSSDGSMTPKGVNMDLSKYSPEQLAEIARAAFRGE